MFANSVRDRACLAALTLPHSRDFLNAVPCRKSGLHLRNDIWTSVVKYQLGEPIYDKDFSCPSCHHQADRMGHHSFVCGTGGEQISRHNALREGLIRLAREAGHNPVREERFLLPGLDRRPADLLIPFGSGAEDLALDVCVTASLRDDVIARGAEQPGYAASLAHARKVRQVGDACLPAEPMGSGSSRLPWRILAASPILLSESSPRSPGTRPSEPTSTLAEL